MFAVIRTGGKQYRVQKGDILEIERLEAEAGEVITFDEVLLVDDGENTLIGTPLVENARVKAEVIENFKGEKVIIFKKKRREQYKRKKGHRQLLSRVRIDEIITSVKEAEVKEKEKIEGEQKKGKVEGEAKRRTIKKAKAQDEQQKASKPKRTSKKETQKLEKEQKDGS